jgi:hypothetical protein
LGAGISTVKRYASRLSAARCQPMCRCPSPWPKGLTGEYFDDIDFAGTQMTRTDATIDYDWGNFSPPGIGPDISRRWTAIV